MMHKDLLLQAIDILAEYIRGASPFTTKELMAKMRGIKYHRKYDKMVYNGVSRQLEKYIRDGKLIRVKKGAFKVINNNPALLPRKGPTKDRFSDRLLPLYKIIEGKIREMICDEHNTELRPFDVTKTLDVMIVTETVQRAVRQVILRYKEEGHIRLVHRGSYIIIKRSLPDDFFIGQADAPAQP